MAVHAVSKQTLGRASPLVSKVTRMPAPIKGIDARTVLSAGDPLYCIYTFNMLPNEYGMRVRKGYREWCIDLENVTGLGLGVGTILPFESTSQETVDDRLFAVTNEGIWDVTNFDAPVFVLDFSLAENGGSISSDVGHGTYTQYTTKNDDQLLFYADSENGLFTYESETDTWERSTGITGPELENISFITHHKEQLWMIETATAKAWYLPAESTSGVATEFFFGGKFKHGGNLAGLFNWTIDGGAGVDDYLVAVSRAGDVIAYKGIDPDSADTWNMVSQYFIGAIPKGGRFGSEHGGNLHLLSAYGLITMDELVRGVDGQDENARVDTVKITAVLRREMEKYRLDWGWDVKLIPNQGFLVVASPERSDGTYRQYAMNTSLFGWGIWRDLPITAFDDWQGKVYFGDKSNRLLVMDVDIDNVLITPDPEAEFNGAPIEFSLLTTYQDLGEPGLFKRGKYVRPDFVSTVTPSQTSLFRYDYELAEIQNTADDVNLFNSGVWDIDLWDFAIWNTEVPEGVNQLYGGWGMGRYIAIAIAGSSSTETTLIGWDIVWDVGAPI